MHPVQKRLKNIWHYSFILHFSQKHARDTHAEALERKQAKKTLRAKNLAAASERPDEDFFVKLDSSLKKNTAFIRKLVRIYYLKGALLV